MQSQIEVVVYITFLVSHSFKEMFFDLVIVSIKTLFVTFKESGAGVGCYIRKCLLSVTSFSQILWFSLRNVFSGNSGKFSLCKVLVGAMISMLKFKSSQIYVEINMWSWNNAINVKLNERSQPAKSYHIIDIQKLLDVDNLDEFINNTSF